VLAARSVGELVLSWRFQWHADGLWAGHRVRRGRHGFGYIVWYLAVRDLSAAHAATVQLSMPAVTALGGVAFLAEPLSLRLLIASAAMLGGIAIVLSQRSHAVP
jgi:EamA-like transporter family